jgi:IS1 family transposase
MDESCGFVRRKRERVYIYTAIGVTKSNKYYYFYHISKDKSSGALFHFKDDLPNIANVKKVYCDGNLAYNNIFGKKATMKKLKKTNVIENLHSQMRDKISYLVRKTKAHAKSLHWLDERLAMFFMDKNLNLG